MDDKDSLFTISHNNDNNNVSDTERAETKMAEITENNPADEIVNQNETQKTPVYDDFMYEPIGFESRTFPNMEYTYLDDSETLEKSVQEIRSL
jgi:hypothetical protein